MSTDQFKKTWKLLVCQHSLDRVPSSEIIALIEKDEVMSSFINHHRMFLQVLLFSFLTLICSGG